MASYESSEHIPVGCVRCAARWSSRWTVVGTAEVALLSGKTATVKLLLCHKCLLAESETLFEEPNVDYRLRHYLAGKRPPGFGA